MYVCAMYEWLPSFGAMTSLHCGRSLHVGSCISIACTWCAAIIVQAVCLLAFRCRLLSCLPVGLLAFRTLDIHTGIPRLGEDASLLLGSIELVGSLGISGPSSGIVRHQRCLLLRCR